MKTLRKIAGKLGKCLLNFSINEDRSIASLGGAPVDFTISGEAGKHRSEPIAGALSDVLDSIQPDHVENADRVDSALVATRAQVGKGT